MSTPTSRYRISLKTSLLLTAVMSVMLYFLFCQEYRFPYAYFASPNRASFMDSASAELAAGQEFTAELEPGVEVEVKLFRSASGDPSGRELSFSLSVTGHYLRTLPSQMSNPEIEIPMTKTNFTAALERELDNQLGVSGSRVAVLHGWYRFPLGRDSK